MSVLSNKLDMLIYCTLQMHVQQATYANELHVNVQHLNCQNNKQESTVTWSNKNEQLAVTDLVTDDLDRGEIK